MLAGLDDISKTYVHPVYYDCIKAALLLEDGHWKEAYTIARNATDMEPFTGPYLTVVRSLVAMNRWTDAVDTLQEWNRVIHTEDIDRILTAFPALMSFCSSPEYLQWRYPDSPAQPQL
jgi:hypothetical protein